MASLFKMGNIDYTRFITMSSYKVNSKPITKEYVDVNQVTHKEFIRNKVSGSFTLKFYDDRSYPDVLTTKTAVENYQDFFDAYNSLRTPNGLIEIEVYLNNRNETKKIKAYMEMEPSNTLPYMNDGSKSYDGFDVTITER